MNDNMAMIANNERKSYNCRCYRHLPENSKNSSLVIMKAAKLAVYMARKTTANMAQTLVIKRAVNPLGESTWTAAWKRTAQTNQYVRNNEKRCDADGVD